MDTLGIKTLPVSDTQHYTKTPKVFEHTQDIGPLWHSTRHEKPEGLGPILEAFPDSATHEKPAGFRDQCQSQSQSRHFQESKRSAMGLFNLTSHRLPAATVTVQRVKNDDDDAKNIPTKDAATTPFVGSVKFVVTELNDLVSCSFYFSEFGQGRR